MTVACTICVIRHGLRHGAPFLFATQDELDQHLEREHHSVVQREGETPADADRRVLADPDICPECRTAIEERLAARA